MTDESLQRATADWIMKAALNGTDMPGLVEAVAKRVLANGVRVSRAYVT